MPIPETIIQISFFLNEAQSSPNTDEIISNDLPTKQICNDVIVIFHLWITRLFNNRSIQYTRILETHADVIID